MHGLLYSAHLLQHVAVQHYAFGEEHLISLCCWLAAHCAGRMQRLRLRLKFVEEDWEELTVMQLSGMLAACCTGGGLVEADVEVELAGKPLEGVSLVIGGWLAGAHSLRRLRVSTNSSLWLDALLHRLTALERLVLDGRGGTGITGLSMLPPGLTHLQLGNNRTDEDGDGANEPTVDSLPHQVHAAAGWCPRLFWLLCSG